MQFWIVLFCAEFTDTSKTIFTDEPRSFDSVMQSIIRRNGVIEKALLYLVDTYASCVLVADRQSGTLQTLTTPCNHYRSQNFTSMLGHTALGDYVFKYPGGKLPRNIIIANRVC